MSLTWLSSVGMWNGCRGCVRHAVEQVACRRFVGDEDRAQTRGDHCAATRACPRPRRRRSRVGAAELVEGDAHRTGVEVVVDDAAVGVDVAADHVADGAGRDESVDVVRVR